MSNLEEAPLQQAVKQHNWKSEPSAYHHCIKKHICHHFHKNKTKKPLEELSESSSAILVMTKHVHLTAYNEKESIKEKLFTNRPSSKAQTFQNIMKSDPTAYIIASELIYENSHQLKRTSAIKNTENHKQKGISEPSASHHCI